MITNLITELGRYGFVLEFIPRGEDKFTVWAVRENEEDPNKTMRLHIIFDAAVTPGSDNHLIKVLSMLTESAEGWERNGYFDL